MTSAERGEIADEEGKDLGGVRTVSFEDSDPRDLLNICSVYCKEKWCGMTVTAVRNLEYKMLSYRRETALQGAL